MNGRVKIMLLVHLFRSFAGNNRSNSPSKNRINSRNFMYRIISQFTILSYGPLFHEIPQLFMTKDPNNSQPAT